MSHNFGSGQSYNPIPIDTEEGIDSLSHWITLVDAGLIVVDPLHAAHSGRSLNDGWSARRTLQKLRELCLLKNVTALVLHHAKLPSRGSSRKRIAENAQLSATASMEIILSQRPLMNAELSIPFSTPKADPPSPLGPSVPSTPSTPSNPSPLGPSVPPTPSTPPRLITLSCRGRGYFANRNLLLVSRDPLDYFSFDPQSPVEPPRPPLSFEQEKIFDLLKTGSKTSAQLMNELGMVEGRFRNALTSLRRQGLVRVVYKRGYLRRYGLTARAKAEIKCANV